MHNIITAILLVHETDPGAAEVMINQWAEKPETNLILVSEIEDPKIRGLVLRAIVGHYLTQRAPAVPPAPKRPVDEPATPAWATEAPVLAFFRSDRIREFSAATVTNSLKMRRADVDEAIGHLVREGKIKAAEKPGRGGARMFGYVKG